MLQLHFHQISISILHANNNNSSYLHPTMKIRSRRHLPPPRSADQEEFEVEFDRDRAREALRRLDEQLQSLNDQEVLPKMRPPSPYQEPYLERDVVTGKKNTEEMPDFSPSYFAYSAAALLILSIFNNIMFNVFVKPSFDVPDQISTIERVPLRDPEQ